MSEAEKSDPRLQGAHRAATHGDFALAEQLLGEVLRDDAASLLALDLLGFVQYFQGRPAEAEMACRRAIAIDPARAYSNKGLGLCLAKQGKVDEGLPFLKEATRIAPDWFDPRWDMVVVLLEAGRYPAAFEALAEAEAALPQHREKLSTLRLELARRSGLL